MSVTINPILSMCASRIIVFSAFILPHTAIRFLLLSIVTFEKSVKYFCAVISAGSSFPETPPAEHNLKISSFVFIIFYHFKSLTIDLK